MIASYGKQLLDWFNDVHLSGRGRVRRPGARAPCARSFPAGMPTRRHDDVAPSFCTVHPESVDAFFEEARGARHAHDCGQGADGPQRAGGAARYARSSGYDEGKALIARWHGRDRLSLLRDAALRGDQLARAARRRGRAVARASRHLSAVAHRRESRRGRWVTRALSGARGLSRRLRPLTARSGRARSTATASGSPRASSPAATRPARRSRTVRRRTHSSAAACSGCTRRCKPARAVRVALATDIGGGTRFSMLATMHEAYKVAQLNGHVADGAAGVLSRHARRVRTRSTWTIASAASRRAWRPTSSCWTWQVDAADRPQRMRHCRRHLSEALFVQMTLGDDRAVRATYVAGAIAAMSPGQATPESVGRVRRAGDSAC